MHYETAGEVTAGRLRLANREQFEAAFASWPDGPVWARFEAAKIFRSDSQSKLWHVMVGKLAKHCGVTARQMHEAMKVKLLPEHVVIPKADGTTLEQITIGGSTKSLSRNEMANVIERTEYLMFAVGLELLPPAKEETHFIDWDAPKVGRGTQRARCGQLVRSRAHAQEPTCTECAQRLKEQEGQRF